MVSGTCIFQFKCFFVVLCADPPNPPTISGYTQGASIRANELERMTCIAVGGNPEAVLKWYKSESCCL